MVAGLKIPFTMPAIDRGNGGQERIIPVGPFDYQNDFDYNLLLF
jgi:hypothetical protein